MKMGQAALLPWSSPQDTLFLQNAAASTAAWGVAELSFHRLPDCSDAAMLFAHPGISGWEWGGWNFRRKAGLW